MLLDKMYRITDNIAVRSLGNETFIVGSFEEGVRIRKEYRTYLETAISSIHAHVITSDAKECLASTSLQYFSLGRLHFMI